MLQRGADASITDGIMNTPLHYAAKTGWTSSIAKKLVEYKNTASDINQENQTPLEMAILNKNNECATFLVKSMEPER